MTDEEFSRYLDRVTPARFPAYIAYDGPIVHLANGKVYVDSSGMMDQPRGMTALQIERHIRVLAFQLTEAADELQRRNLSRP